MAKVFIQAPLLKPVCWHFRDKGGSCAKGEACQFLHVVAGDFRSGLPSLLEDTPEWHGADERLYYWLFRMPRDESQYHLLVATLEANGFRRAVTPEQEALAQLLWCGTSTIPPSRRLDDLPVGSSCIVNRLGCGMHLTQKDLLVLSLRRKGQACLAPLTFILPSERPHLLRHTSRGDGSNVSTETWIVKPFGMGCGRGIYVTQNVEKRVPPGDKCVVSRYITQASSNKASNKAWSS